MTERELRRTALIIPPRGRAVLCCWAAIPGLLVAPFVFWQSLPAGVVFCLLWAALVAVVYQRACSYAAALGAETLTVYSGIVFPLRRAIRRRAVTGLFSCARRCSGWQGYRWSSSRHRARGLFYRRSRQSRPLPSPMPLRRRSDE